MAGLQEGAGTNVAKGVLVTKGLFCVVGVFDASTGIENEFVAVGKENCKTGVDVLHTRGGGGFVGIGGGLVGDGGTGVLVGGRGV